STSEQLTITQPRWIFDNALFDLGVQLRHALIVEGHLAAHQNVEDDAEAPHVDLGTRVLLRLQQLWSGKVEASAKRLESTLGGEE
nr:hypothetical protein [Tanacetum cinerariifolium]